MIRYSQSGMLTVVAEGKSYVIPPDHPNYNAIYDAACAGQGAKVTQLADIPKTIREFVKGHVEVKDGTVFYLNEPLHHGVATRILELVEQKKPFEPMVHFLDNLMDNPSRRARDELFNFLEHKGLPITEDGCFLGYKAVRADWTDKHSGRILNTVGRTISMPRRDCDDNYLTDCSYGFHVGAMEYMNGFASGGDRIILVKVNPKDVVTVPPNERTKLRTCEYTVVQEYGAGDKRSVLPEACYKVDGDKLTPTPSVDDEDDDDEEEDICDDCGELLDACTCGDNNDDDDLELDLDDDEEEEEDEPGPPRHARRGERGTEQRRCEDRRRDEARPCQNRAGT